MKASVQTVMLAFLFGLPWAIGFDPIQYHLSWFLSPPGRPILVALGLTIGVFGSYQLLNVVNGWMKLARKYNFSKTVKKVCRSFLTPVPLAIVEEAVFRRCRFWDQLLDAFPATSSGLIFAVLLSAFIFCSVHFIRPLKKTILPAIGLFSLGIVLAISYILAGRNCWLPITIHSAGVSGHSSPSTVRGLPRTRLADRLSVLPHLRGTRDFKPDCA